MARSRNTSSEAFDTSTKVIPSLTPDSKENELIALAVGLAEQQLRDGTASAQVIAHYLKLGTSRERLEKERLEEENKLLRAKTENLKSAAKTEEFYIAAIEALKLYSGNTGVPK